jgi:sugar lactone lactonase YvrE/4-amino-4-deoxy-L-arabinose transferase-like glycosyltransferase
MDRFSVLRNPIYRLGIILLAFVLCLSNVALLRGQDSPRVLNVLLFVLAGLLFALATRAPAPWPDVPPRSRWPGWALALMLVGVALAGVAIVLFWRAGNSPTQFTGLPLVFWFLSIPVFLLGAGEVNPLTLIRLRTAGYRPSKSETLLLLVILLLALVLRVYQIDTFPNGCQSDECNNGMDALHWLEGRPYTPYAETNEGQATFFTLLIALAFRLLGVGVTQMRLVSAISATLTILVFYFLARDWLGWRIALASTALFAVSRWHLTFSRIVYELILTPLAEILLFLFLLRALRDGRRRDWAWAGICLAFGLHTYTAFRVVPFLVAVFLLYWCVTHRTRFVRDLEGIGVLAGGALVGVAPLGVYIAQHWSVFVSRTQHISIFNNIREAGGSWQPLWDTLYKTLWSFHWRGDWAALNNLPSAPLLDVVVGALFVLGLAYALRHFYHPLPFLYITWVVMVGSLAVMSSALEAPTARRPIGLLPVIFLLVGMALKEAWETCDMAWPHVSPSTRAGVGGLVLAAMVLYVGVTNADTFFNKQAKHPAVWRAYSATEAAVGQYLRDLAPDARVYLSPSFAYHSSVSLISHERAYTILNLSEHLPLHVAQTLPGDVVYILDVMDRQLEPLLRQTYPGGQWEIHADPFGEPMFITFRVPSDVVNGVYGLKARYYANAKMEGPPALERHDASINFDWTSAPPLPGPFSARWEGSLMAAGGYGEYVFELTAAGDAELMIDDKPLIQLAANGGSVSSTQAQSVTLVGGLHPILITYHGGVQPGKLVLSWSGPQIAPGPVPPDAFYTADIARYGLVGYYYPNGDATGSPTLIQRDLFILPNAPLPEPFSIAWHGKIVIRESGPYLFGVRADDGALLFIDGTLVVDNGGSHGAEYREGSITLNQGLHAIELRYWQLGGSRDLQLSWQPPVRPREVVPSIYLLPIEDAAPKGFVLSKPLASRPTPTSAVPPSPPPSLPISAAQATPATASPGSMPELVTQIVWRIGSCGNGAGQFSEPRGVAVDASGNIYVADTGNRRIVKLDSQGEVVKMWGEEGEGDGQFLEPFDLGVSPDGTLIVLDSLQQRLQRFTAEGSFVSSLGERAGFYRPRGMWVDGQGNVWVADTGSVRVVKLDQAGNLLLSIGGPDYPPVGLGQPTDVAVGQEGSIWIVEADTGTLWRLAADGTIVNSAKITPAGTIDGPHLALGPGGSLYVTDAEGFRIVALGPNAALRGQMGRGQLRRAIGIAVDAQGRVIVTDTPTCQVIAFGLK